MLYKGGMFVNKSIKERVDIFEQNTKDLESKGYKATDLTMGIVKANVLTSIIGIPFFILVIWGYMKIHRINDLFEVLEYKSLFWFLLITLALTVVHELIHGFTWSLFTPNKFNDVAFGIMWKYLTPYASCKVPLGRREYVLGALMPLIILGIIPTIIGFIIQNILITILGVLFITAAGGDIILAILILKYKTSSEEILILDLPTAMGARLFEK